MTKQYCEKHDAYFDSKTGTWFEDECKDEDCMFCSKRPTKHIPHKWVCVNNDKEICE